VVPQSKDIKLTHTCNAALRKSGECVVAFCSDPTIALVCGAEQVGARLAGCVVFLI